MKNLLKIREQVKAKKPEFLRQQGRNLKKLKQKWRAPRGMHSKLRKKLRGYISHPSRGYSSPKLVRGFSPKGVEQVLVKNENQINTIEKDQGILISSTLGMKKRLQMLKKSKEKNLTILNIKNVDNYIKQIEEELKKRKDEKSKKVKKKEKTKKEAEEKVKEQKEKAKEETPEEKEKKEKEQKRKVLEAK